MAAGNAHGPGHEVCREASQKGHRVREASYRSLAADVQTVCTEAIQMKDALSRAVTLSATERTALRLIVPAK